MIATSYQWLLLLHILAAMIWVRAVAVVNVQATFLLRQSDPDGVRRFRRTMRTLGPALLLPAVVALLVFGIWMVLDSDFDFEQTWVWIGIVLFAAAMVVGGAFQSRAALAAERAAAAGDNESATAQLRRWTWGMRLINVLLVVAAWDMVFKPRL